MLSMRRTSSLIRRVPPASRAFHSTPKPASPPGWPIQQTRAESGTTGVIDYQARLHDSPEKSPLRPAGRDYLDLNKNGQKDPYETSSIIHDDRALLELRVKQIRHPRAHARQPLARTVHQVGNVVQLGETNGELQIGSTLTVVEFRNDKQRVYGALVEHRLRPHGNTFRIARKRIDLVNSEGELDGIAILL